MQQDPSQLKQLNHCARQVQEMCVLAYCLADTLQQGPKYCQKHDANCSSGQQQPAHLSEETRMVLVEHDAVVVLTTSITATSRVLAVLANTTVASTDVATLLAVAVQPCQGGAADPSISSSTPN